MIRDTAAVAYGGEFQRQGHIKYPLTNISQVHSKPCASLCDRSRLLCHLTLTLFHQTVISGEVFLLAIALHPEVQARAQEEIDRVVGTHRLPDFVDRDRLPYVTAIMKEILRWHPPAPTGASP